ncbi:MAG: YbeD family protein [Anaerolineaceae bacterium]
MSGKILNGDPKTELIFPCFYPIRVMGLDRDDFAGFVIELVSRHVPEICNADFSTRSSSGGKYLSVTAAFTAQSREQVDALNKELAEHPRVLFTL